MEVRINGEIQEIADDIDLLINIVNWICPEIQITPESIDIILVDDETLREMHKIYLDDDTNTDVMTFNLGDNKSIEGEIYISMPGAIAQAKEYGNSLIQEMIRLVIHACLHLAGHDDLDEKKQKTMKALEDKYVEDAYGQFLIS